MVADSNFNAPLLLQEVEELTVSIFNSIQEIDALENEISTTKFLKEMVISVEKILENSTLQLKS